MRSWSCFVVGCSSHFDSCSWRLQVCVLVVVVGCSWPPAEASEARQLIAQEDVWLVHKPMCCCFGLALRLVVDLLVARLRSLATRKAYPCNWLRSSVQRRRVAKVLKN